MRLAAARGQSTRGWSKGGGIRAREDDLVVAHCDGGAVTWPARRVRELGELRPTRFPDESELLTARPRRDIVVDLNGDWAWPEWRQKPRGEDWIGEREW